MPQVIMEVVEHSIQFNELDGTTQRAVMLQLHKSSNQHSTLSFNRTQVRKALVVCNPTIDFGKDHDNARCFLVATGLDRTVQYLESLYYLPADMEDE